MMRRRRTAATAWRKAEDRFHHRCFVSAEFSLKDGDDSGRVDCLISTFADFVGWLVVVPT